MASDCPETTPEPTAPPTVSAFIARLQEMNKEIGCDGERIGSHKIRSTVRFADTEGNSYRLKDIEALMLFGCGCWDGFTIVLEKEPDDE